MTMKHHAIRIATDGVEGNSTMAALVRLRELLEKAFADKTAVDELMGELDGSHPHTNFMDEGSKFSVDYAKGFARSVLSKDEQVELEKILSELAPAMKQMAGDRRLALDASIAPRIAKRWPAVARIGMAV